MNCGTCRHYQQVDAREAMMDPGCIYMVCTWKPLQPFWVPVPYLSRDYFGVNLAAVRKLEDGVDCPTWEPKA